MVKRKTTRRGASETLASPREKHSQDAPVTDTVMQVITRRIRNARKKLQKVTVIEELLEKDHTLNEDQERVYLTKTPLTAVIEELLKLEPLVEAALANELEERMKTVKEQWMKGESSMPTDAAQMTSETGESETTVEGPSRMKLEEEQEETSSVEQEATVIPPAHTQAYDDAAEAMYFIQLFTKGRFDLRPFVGDDIGEEGVLNVDEVEVLESFGKRMFQTTAHTPQDALESIKEATRLLVSRSNEDTSKVFDAVSKLKASDIMTLELKPTVHGFPIAFDKEESDTVTDQSEEQPKTETIPTQIIPPADVPPSTGHLDFPKKSRNIPTEENPPPSSPVHPIPPTFVPEVVPMPSKSPRPFLPFPGVTVSGGPPIGYTMTQSPMMGMHSFFSMAPVSGSYMQPVSYHPTQPPQTDLQSSSHEHTTEPPIETEPTEFDPEIKENFEAAESPTQEESPLDVPEDSDPVLPEEPVASTPEASALMGDPRHPSAIVRPRPSGGRFDGDYRPYQGGRGRYPYPPNRPASRGRGRGRPPYSYAPRRPYDSSHSSHRPYLPDRHSYDRRRRGGYQ